MVDRTTDQKLSSLKATKSPNLPVAPIGYSQQYQDQLNNALRLYFAQLDNFSQPLSTGAGGVYINNPYGAFHYDKTTALTAGITNVSTTPIPVTSTASYPNSGAILIGTEIITYTAITPTTFAGTITRGAYSTSTSAHITGDVVTSVQGTVAATATPMYLNSTDFSNGVALAGPDNTSKIEFQYAGIFNLQFSAQFTNSSTSDDNVTVWIRQSGSDIAQSAGVATIPSKHGSTAGAAIVGWNEFIEVTRSSYIELYWITDSGASVLQTYPASTGPTHPVSPALIVTTQFVSAL